MTYSRKSFSGNAIATQLSGNVTSSATSIPVGATTGWPNTADGPFIVCLDRGTASEEKIEVSSYTLTSLTCTRGADGTTPVAHSSGATAVPTLDAGTIDNHETFVAGNGTVTPTTSAVGDDPAEGTSAFPAAGDHVHGREPWATGYTSSSAPGDTEDDGVSDSSARADHKHAREPAPGTQCPIGAVILWPGPSDTLPDNFHVCDHSAISRTTYASCFAILGTLWGVGDGTTTFNLPGAVDNWVVGAGNDFYVGQTGIGNSSIDLSAAMIPPLTITITDGEHTHTAVVSDPTHGHDGQGGNEIVIHPSSSTLYASETVTGGNQISFTSGSTGTTTNATGVTVTNDNAATGITAAYVNGSQAVVPLEPPSISMFYAIRIL